MHPFNGNSSKERKDFAKTVPESCGMFGLSFLDRFKENDESKNTNE
jgi:hypothetical protein